jgi:hypothetical protein
MGDESMAKESDEVQRIFKVLEASGLLPASDSQLPSVSSLVVGAPVRGSWWGHPRAHDIFRVAMQLDDHPDVLATKLVSGKVTFVHRKLWSALLAVACAREPWQWQELSGAARSLLDLVMREGVVQTDELRRSQGLKAKAPGEAARELETRLLIHTEEIHTSSGAHAKRLETWERWASRVGFTGKKMSPERGKRQLEEAVRQLSGGLEVEVRLPWMRSLRASEEASHRTRRARSQFKIR